MVVSTPRLRFPPDMENCVGGNQIGIKQDDSHQSDNGTIEASGKMLTAGTPALYGLG
jgi:hypothetical protein